MDLPASQVPSRYLGLWDWWGTIRGPFFPMLSFALPTEPSRSDHWFHHLPRRVIPYINCGRTGCPSQLSKIEPRFWRVFLCNLLSTQERSYSWVYSRLAIQLHRNRLHGYILLGTGMRSMRDRTCTRYTQGWGGLTRFCQCSIPVQSLFFCGSIDFRTILITTIQVVATCVPYAFTLTLTFTLSCNLRFTTT